MSHPKCTNTKSYLKQTVTRTTSQGNWLSYRESCLTAEGYRCYWKQRLLESQN